MFVYPLDGWILQQNHVCVYMYNDRQVQYILIK